MIWSLPVPMRLVTSQTKVWLTESSTFNTLSSCSFFSTVSGKTPDILRGGANSIVWLRKLRRGQKLTEKPSGKDNGMTKANGALQRTMSSESANHDGGCKTNQSRCSSQQTQLYLLFKQQGKESGKASCRVSNLIPIFNFQILLFLFFKFGHSLN